MRRATLLACGMAPALAWSARFDGRPGLAEAETVPGTSATCETLPATLAGLTLPSERVDLWVSGRISLVQTDGALFYVAICSAPQIRVLCVTYQGNGLTVGQTATLRGALSRQDDLRYILDPCLAAAGSDAR